MSKISQYTELTSPSGDDLLVIVDDPSGTPVTKKVTVNNLNRIVQIVNTQTGAVATGTTQIPFDDTIPQNTEGDEYMTLAITPTNASNKLLIEIQAFVTSSLANWITIALFQDSVANALAATTFHNPTNTAGGFRTLVHYMTAGTTSSTTLKVRIGVDGAATTVTFNGQSGARRFGGVMASSITITEIRA